MDTMIETSPAEGDESTRRGTATATGTATAAKNKYDVAESHNQYLPLPVFYFLPSVYFVIHATEEVPAFGPWATKHFAPLSTGLFATVHIPLILLVFLVSYQAAQRQKHGGWVIFAIATQIQFGLNALFHLTTAALFLEYAPGMVTGGTLGLLLTFYMLVRVWQEKLLSGRELAIAFVVGMILAIAAISVLFVH